ncbi:hypothetical protein [Pantoea sp. CCBC3-3-1]|uniref:hypothetical protein n=1 Tax=Pantoea sp. CCBC3-3-1 TaxID=2490851 RepID=UPI0011BE0665|nr:hypothetical protein [Pantoea sp. CCBC3-3-1]
MAKTRSPVNAGLFYCVPGQHGEDIRVENAYYECGSCIGDNHDEVQSEYVYLNTQLTRRAAFLTMFGLFEHRMTECQKLMETLSGDVWDKDKYRTFESADKKLRKTIGGKSTNKLDHLAAVRNVMAHNDGIAFRYKQDINQPGSDAALRRLRAIRKAVEKKMGVSVNGFNGVLLDKRFLMCAVDEFKQYIDGMEAAINAYLKATSKEGMLVAYD